MVSYLTGVAAVLLMTLALGLVRVRRGPTPSDRMLSVLLSGTTGAALLLVLSALDQSMGKLDVALVLAVLAPVSAAAFVAASPRPRQ